MLIEHILQELLDIKVPRITEKDPRNVILLYEEQ